MIQNGLCKKVEGVCSYKTTTILHMQKGELKRNIILIPEQRRVCEGECVLKLWKLVNK